MASIGKSLKLGLIGCGQIAQAVHLQILTRLPGVDLTALAETDEHRLEQAGRKAPKADRFTDYTQLLAMPEIQAVVICLPNALHAEVAIAAMRQGKNLYLEKPLATNIKEAQQVLNVWWQTGVVGMIGFNYRFNQLYQTTKRVVQSAQIGEIVGIRSAFVTAAHYLPQWKQRRDTGGGALLDLASHDVDLVRFIIGQEVAEVSASTRSLFNEGDTATMEMRMENGLQVQLFFSFGAVEEATFEIYGNSGKVSLNRYELLSPQLTGTRASGKLKRIQRGLRSITSLPYLVEKLRSPMNEPSFAKALGHFASAVRGNHIASPDLMDGYRSLAVIEAAEKSARTGCVVAPESTGATPRPKTSNCA